MKENNFQPLSEKEVRRIATQLVHTLQVAHSKGVFHKDIKLENIITDTARKNTYLLDFGLCSLSPEPTTDFAGSREYSCPEIIFRDTFSPEKADIWSLGVTLFSLLYGVFPFAIKLNEYVIIQQTRVHPAAYFPLEAKRSKDCVDLLKKMLEVNPKNRATLTEVVEHPWLKKKRFLSF
jgi:serine/threonine protein kinase